MKKKLINLENIKEFIVDKEFYKTKNMIISPNVNDYLKINGIKTVTQDTPKEECIIMRIKKILKTDFKITDDSILKKITTKVEEAIKNGY